MRPQLPYNQTLTINLVTLMKTLVIGGTGFLGRHIVDRLLQEGHHVAVMSRSPESAARRVDASVEVVKGDITQLGKRALKALLTSFDGLVYAAGADERTPPDTEAREFYVRENVDVCRKVLQAAGQAGISRVVLLNSIFTHINRSHPELELTQHHPYVDSRVQQSEMALAVSKGKFVVTVLEIPWVFGNSYEQTSQWAMMVNYARGAAPLVSPRGGTVAISADNVARATAGALLYPTQSSSLPIGDRNISWDELLLTLSRLAGRENIALVRLPDAAMAGMFRMSALGQSLIGAKTGLDFARMHDLLLQENYIDPSESQQLLRYGSGCIETALAETVACVPEVRALGLWRKVADTVVPKASKPGQVLLAAQNHG